MMAKIIHFKQRDVVLEDAPRCFVRACPKCRRRKYVTAHFEGGKYIVLVCGHCFLMGRSLRENFTAGGRPRKSKKA
jgi:hypothetical protein